VPRDLAPLTARQILLDVTGILSSFAVTAASLAAGVRLSAQDATPARAKKEVRGNAIKGTTDAVRTYHNVLGERSPAVKVDVVAKDLADLAEKLGV